MGPLQVHRIWEYIIPQLKEFALLWLVVLLVLLVLVALLHLPMLPPHPCGWPHRQWTDGLQLGTPTKLSWCWIGMCPNMEWKLWATALIPVLLRAERDFFLGGTKGNGILETQGFNSRHNKFHSFSHGSLRKIFFSCYHKKPTSSVSRWGKGARSTNHKMICSVLLTSITEGLMLTSMGAVYSVCVGRKYRSVGWKGGWIKDTRRGQTGEENIQKEGKEFASGL